MSERIRYGNGTTTAMAVNLACCGSMVLGDHKAIQLSAVNAIGYGHEQSTIEGTCPIENNR